MKKKSINKRKIRKDCWDLDLAFIQWLRKRLPVFLHDAQKMVDLSYHKFTYQDQEYTLETMIKLLIQKVEDVTSLDLYDTEYLPTVESILDIWKLIFNYMWW